jgi:glycosyltransferase involved in cell wall biosynthesis
VRILLAGTGVQPIPPSGYGGVERTIAEYATALERLGHTATIVNEVRHRRSRDEVRFAWRLPRLIANAPFDVVHASTPVVANRLATAGYGLVYTSHSRHWFDRSTWRGRWGHWLEGRAVRRAAHTVALTEALRRQMVADVGETVAPRISVLPIGVDTEKFRPDWSSRTGARALGVGVVLPFKRWEVAAAALRGTGLRLQIAGPRPDPGYAQTVRSAGEGVELLGEVDEATLGELYARSDVLVHPSRVELLAGVVLQALAAGLPVIGAAPVADLIAPGAGACAPADATDADLVRFFHEQADRFGADAAERRRAGELARSSAEARFAWPRVAAAHVRLYESLRAAGRLTRPGSPST